MPPYDKQSKTVAPLANDTHLMKEAHTVCFKWHRISETPPKNSIVRGKIHRDHSMCTYVSRLDF